MNMSSIVREQLAVANVKHERFREIIGRLLASGVVVREEDGAEQMLYDDIRRVEALVEEYFEIGGLRLYHDQTNQYYRLYGPGAVVDGQPADPHAPVTQLRARLSTDFVAAALALRFLYQNKFDSGDILESGEVLINFEELAATMQTQLKRTLPATSGDKMALLGELKRHRLIRMSSSFAVNDEDALLAIRPIILGVVNNDAMSAVADGEGVAEAVTVESEGQA